MQHCHVAVIFYVWYIEQMSLLVSDLHMAMNTFNSRVGTLLQPLKWLLTQSELAENGFIFI